MRKPRSELASAKDEYEKRVSTLKMKSGFSTDHHGSSPTDILPTRPMTTLQTEMAAVGRQSVDEEKFQRSEKDENSFQI